LDGIRADGLTAPKMSGKPKQRILLEGENSMQKDNGQSDKIIDYNQFNSGQCDTGTSIKTGLMTTVGVIAVLVGISLFTWKQAPTSFKDIVVNNIPFIEVVKPDKGWQILRQTPGPSMKPPVRTTKMVDKKPFAPLYQIKAILNDGNQVRIDLNVEYIVKNDGGPVSNHHAEVMVRMAVRKVIAEYNTESLYKSNGLLVQGKVQKKLQEKYFSDIIEVKVFNLNAYFDVRTKAMFDARNNAKHHLEIAKQQVEMAKQKKLVIEAEMAVKKYEQKRILELQRERALYEAETQRMVDDILKKKLLLDAKPNKLKTK
jgi:hypothetical protein